MIFSFQHKNQNLNAESQNQYKMWLTFYYYIKSKILKKTTHFLHTNVKSEEKSLIYVFLHKNGNLWIRITCFAHLYIKEINEKSEKKLVALLLCIKITNSEKCVSDIHISTKKAELEENLADLLTCVYAKSKYDRKLADNLISV